MSQEELKNEIRTLKNRVLYLEQVQAASAAHFNAHGHREPVNASITGRPAPFKMPPFRSEMEPVTARVAAPKVETEVRPVFLPGTKPQPLPTP